MAEQPGGKGPTLYEFAGWMQAALALPFRAVGWALRKDVAPPSIPLWSGIAPRWRWIIVIVLCAVAGSTVLFALWLWFHVLLVAVGWTPTKNPWDDIRFGLLIVAGVLSAPFVVWRTMIADRQTTINQQTHFTDLYTKAVEMLGADKTVRKRVEKPGAPGAPAMLEDVETTEPNIEVRLGAIYALQRIMNQSDADYLPILRTLCAYVRENATFQETPSFSEGAPLPEPPEPPEGRDETPEELAERLEAIRIHTQNLQAWGKRLREKAAARGVASAQRPDIRAALDVLCDRDKARRLKLEGIESVEPPAVELGDWPLDIAPEAARARLETHRTEFRQWAGTGERLDLAAAALQGASRARADLRRADLNGAQLQGADFDSTQMQGADLAGAMLQGAILCWAKLQGAYLTGARMQGVDLTRAHMQGAFLSGSRMQGAFLLAARMEGAYLMYTELSGAYLPSARLQRAVLTGAYMQGSDLRKVQMQWSDLSEARMRGANLSGADFTAAIGLTYDQLASAFGDAATKLPPNLEALRPRLIAEAGWAEDEIL